MNHHNHDIDIVIFHGDDTSFPGNGQIAITIDTELDLTGMSAHFQLCNFVQTFPVIPEDKTLLINVPAAYTEKFPVGCTFAKVWLVDATGLKRTLANTLSVLVTNRVDLAYATDSTQAVTVAVKGVVTWESIQGKPKVVLSVNGSEPDKNGNVEVEAGLPECTIEDMPEEFTEDEMRLKVNEIINWCKGGTAMIAAILSLAAFGEPTVNLTVETAQKGKILNTASIVTNVSATLSGMEDLASVSITNGLRSYADLSYDIKTVTHYASGTEPWTVVYHNRENVLTNKSANIWDNRTSSPTEGSGAMRLYYEPSVTSDEYGWWTLEEEEWHEDYGWGPVDGEEERPAMLPDLVDSIVFDRLGAATRELSLVTTNVTHDALALTSQVSTSLESLQSRTNDWNTAAGWATTNYLPTAGGTVTGTVTANGGIVAKGAISSASSFSAKVEGNLNVHDNLIIGGRNTLNTFDGPTLVIGGGAVYGSDIGMGVAIGAGALVTNSNSFVWCGRASRIQGSHGNSTFNINPANGLAGFYIGDTNMATHLAAKQDTLPYPTNAIPYAVLIGTPSIPTVPTQVSAFNNDAGYVNALAVTNIAESAVAYADTTYRLTVGVTNLNQSVQYVALDDTTTELAISLPTGDGAKDWLVYVNAATNTTLILPAATWWMSDEAFTNAIPAGLTALYFSQISTNGVYSLGRQEMTPITIP